MFMSSESDSKVLREFLSRRRLGDFPARRLFIAPSLCDVLFIGLGVMNEASGVDVVDEDCDAEDEIGNVTPFVARRSKAATLSLMHCLSSSSSSYFVSSSEYHS